jgi:ketosteroid isomerase-like protein
MLEPMSRENAELIRRGYEALDRGGLQALFEMTDDIGDSEIEVRAVGRLPDVGGVRGREAVKSDYAELYGTFDWRLEPEEFIDAGDAVLVVVRQIARGKGSGAEVSKSRCPRMGFARGKVTYHDVYRTKEEAIEAGGYGESPHG